MRHLIIFTRAPQLGTVKRRLAADIGEVAALRFHRAMQAQLFSGVGKDRRWKTWVAVTPDFRGRIKPPACMTLLRQGRGDLGRRMAHCFRSLPPGPAVLVGSDIPGMRAAHIARAFAELGRKDAVFGPARDGGYWLAGLKRLRALGGPHGKNLFSGIRWSSPHALDDTLAALGKRARTGFTQTLGDIDNAADYHHWRRLCSSSRGMISTKLQGRNR
ncbi:MAG: TIGR04282 family arsenosugar biosynthesis glycosyltransferase [Alphaproteobacteria bacterium]